MAGNVWEWTRSLWGKEWGKPEFAYPYDPEDRHREDLDALNDVARVLRAAPLTTIAGMPAVRVAAGATRTSGTGASDFG